MKNLPLNSDVHMRCLSSLYSLDRSMTSATYEPITASFFEPFINEHSRVLHELIDARCVFFYISEGTVLFGLAIAGELLIERSSTSSSAPSLLSKVIASLRSQRFFHKAA